MKKPFLTKILEFILQPLIGKSVVMYFWKLPNSIAEKEKEIDPAENYGQTEIWEKLRQN